MFETNENMKLVKGNYIDIYRYMYVNSNLGK